ncbi:phage tail tape measure protein [Klebsiella oxytoca]|uniref:phage tail tape measure protein n=1 Tax=Klebsiella oxytoca TaxID=571 RepID=UPI0022473312|nr:phage tail tape measure protein [Klebsiella oxytoca]MCW9548011.1 phage tail tape measure protein [Klebsiella oxytoca]
MSRMMELAWKLSGKMDGSLKTATQKAKTSISDIGKAASKVQKQVGGITSRIGKLAAVLTGGALTGGGAGMLALAKNAAYAGDELLKLSSRLGVGSESLSKWIYAAGSAGISQDKFSDSTKKLNANISAAAQGSKTAQLAFARAGVKIRDTTGKLKSTDQVLLEVSDMFKKMPEGIYKADLAIALFGQSGAAMVPLLEKGRAEILALQQEGKELGHVFSDTEAQMAGEFASGLDYVKNAVAGVGQTIGRRLIPVLLPVIRQISAWITANRGLINTKIDETITRVSTAIDGLKSYLPALIENIRSAWTTADNFAQSLGGWPRLLKIIVGGFVAIKGIQFAAWLVNVGGAVLGVSKALILTIPVIARFGAALLANPIGIVVAAIGGLIAAGYLLWKNWDTVTAGIKNVWESVKNYFTGAISEVIDAFDSGFINGLTTIFNKFNPVVLVAKGVNAVIKYLTGVDLAKTGAEFINKFGQGLLNKWESIKGNIVDKVTGWLPDWMTGGGNSDNKKIPAFANGGLVTRPQMAMVGEDGAEMIIPLTRRERGRELLSQAAASLGVSNDRATLADAVSASQSSGSIVFPAFSPQISITGAESPQATGEQVSRALDNALGDFKRQMNEYMYQLQRRGGT